MDPIVDSNLNSHHRRYSNLYSSALNVSSSGIFTFLFSSSKFHNFHREFRYSYSPQVAKWGAKRGTKAREMLSVESIISIRRARASNQISILNWLLAGGGRFVKRTLCHSPRGNLNLIISGRGLRFCAQRFSSSSPFHADSNFSRNLTLYG